MNRVEERLRGAIVEVRGTASESAQDRSFDFGDVVEATIDQGLAKVGRGFAIARRQISGWV